MDDFLPSQAPPNARLQVVDFTTSNPALPAYKGRLAAVINDILTHEECSELLRRVEASTTSQDASQATPTWERAMINTGNGKQALATDVRNCGRIILDDHDLANRLLTRLLPFLQTLELDTITDRPLITGLAGRGKTYRLTRVNERLRFLRYQGGEFFDVHGDGVYVTPDRQERSFITIHLYLNGEGEQDLDELRREKRAAGDSGQHNRDVDGRLLGGATSFMEMTGIGKEDQHMRVFPRTGSVLVFQQRDLLHSGDPVVRGTKYTMRSDIMYRQEA